MKTIQSYEKGSAVCWLGFNTYRYTLSFTKCKSIEFTCFHLPLVGATDTAGRKYQRSELRRGAGQSSQDVQPVVGLFVNGLEEVSIRLPDVTVKI